MSSRRSFMIAAGLAGIAGSSASALPTTVQVGIGGGELGLRAFDFSDTVFGGAPLGEFTSGALQSIHGVLNAAGVTTDGWITVVAAMVDTDGTPGADQTALMWLVDDEVAGDSGDPTPSTISFQSGITKASGAAAWINDVRENITVSEDAPGFDKQAFGSFAWLDETHGDAFAWSGLGTGDTGNFRFLSPQWIGFEGLQFVSYDAGSDSWVVLESFTGFGALQAFTFTVIPLPPAALSGLAGIAGLGLLRRRLA
jgi:hypothetical protein